MNELNLQAELNFACVLYDLDTTKMGTSCIDNFPITVQLHFLLLKMHQLHLFTFVTCGLGLLKAPVYLYMEIVSINCGEKIKTTHRILCEFESHIVLRILFLGQFVQYSCTFVQYIIKLWLLSRWV